MRRLTRIYVFVVIVQIFSGCSDPITPEMNGGGDQQGGEEIPVINPEEMTQRMKESLLLVRVLPVMGAERICSAVAIQPDLLLTSASCLANGVRYAEVKRGEIITFQDNEPRTGIAFKVFKNSTFIEGFQSNNGSDVGLIKLKGGAPDVPIVDVFVGDPIGLELTRVGYNYRDNSSFQQVVTFASPPQIIGNAISFSGEGGLTATECEITGAPVFTFVGDRLQVVAVSGRGDASCTQNGSASLIAPSTDFLNQVYGGTFMPAEGEQTTVQAGLSCAESLNCYYDVCYSQYLSMEAAELLNALFLCSDAMGCQDIECYMRECLESFNACIGIE